MPRKSVSVRAGSGTADVQEQLTELESVRVYGYKSIAKPCTVKLTPLTLLAGPNSSGKSSLFQPILLVKQTLDTPYDPGPLLLDGPNVNLTSADQIFARQTGKATPVPRFGVRFDLEGERMLELRFSRPTTRRGLIVGSM